MKINLKCVVFFIVALVIALIPVRANATSGAVNETFSGIIRGGSTFLTKGDNVSKIVEANDVKKVSDFLYKTLFGIAVVIAIVVGLVLGIQFMIGSIDEQAKIKEALIPYVVACFVIFGAFTIWKIVVNWGEDIEGELAEFAGDATTSQGGGSSTHTSSSGTTHGGGGF